MATVCQNKNRRWCLMYDSTNHRCNGLSETSKSRTCTFFKDRRYLTTEQREQYKNGVAHGFIREGEEIRFSSFDSGRFK